MTAACSYRYENKSVDFVECLIKAKLITGKNWNKLFINKKMKTNIKGDKGFTIKNRRNK